MRLFVRLLLVLVGLSAVAGATWVYGQQRKPKSHVLLAPEDYIEIMQLYAMYSRDVDPGSRRNAAWMFAEDSVSQMGPSRTYLGAEEVKGQYAASRIRNKSGVRHFNGTYVIVGTPEGARGSAYMMTLEHKERGMYAVTAFGKYEDRFVKTPDGWRFKERIWRGEPFLGSDEPILPSPIPDDRSNEPIMPSAWKR